jgi:hypothetical protein
MRKKPDEYKGLMQRAMKDLKENNQVSLYKNKIYKERFAR